VDTSPHKKLSVTVDKTQWFIFIEYQCKSNKLNTLSIIFIRDSQHPDEVYSIQHYVIKFVSDLRQVGGINNYFLCIFSQGNMIILMNTNPVAVYLASYIVISKNLLLILTKA
jgi:hypothetical protein